jgi:ferredoxin
MVRIIHFRGKCIGCNACVEIHPDRWRMSRSDGKCVLIDGHQKKDHFTALVHDLEYEANESAAANCPVKVIRVMRTSNDKRS